MHTAVVDSGEMEEVSVAGGGNGGQESHADSSGGGSGRDPEQSNWAAGCEGEERALLGARGRPQLPRRLSAAPGVIMTHLQPPPR